MVTLFEPPGFTVVIHYLSLFVVVWLVCYYVLGRWWRSMHRAVPWILIVIVWAGYYWIDRYEKVWTNERNGITCTYNDWHWRSSSSSWPYYRRFSFPDPKERFWSLTSEGGFTPSGKKHGLWTEDVFLPKKEDISLYEAEGYDCGQLGLGCTKKTWYWYGEEVSEGEWHVRNK